MSIDLAFTPIGRYFELTEIRDWLDARPDTFEDPWRPNRYLINGYPETATFALEQTYADSSQRPLGCVVYLSLHEICVIQELGTTASLRSTLAFLTWLTEHYACAVRVDDKLDLTEQVQRDGIASLYRYDDRTAPLAWESTLIPVGFYADLEHGQVYGPSIERACRDSAGVDDDRLATYLDGGHVYRRVESTARDVLDGDRPICPAHLLTDGVYVWPADLSYYVRHYHVTLPKAFVIHVQTNTWQVPRYVDLTELPEYETR